MLLKLLPRYPWKFRRNQKNWFRDNKNLNEIKTPNSNKFPKNQRTVTNQLKFKGRLRESTNRHNNSYQNNTVSNQNLSRKKSMKSFKR